RQSRELLVSVPRQSPHFVPRDLVLADSAQIRNAGRARRIEAEHRVVLNVLRQREGSALQNENAMRMRLVARDESLRQHRSEAPATDHDRVERPRIDASRACKRLVEAVADESTQHIATEVCGLRNRAGHDAPPAGSLLWSSGRAKSIEMIANVMAELPLCP